MLSARCMMLITIRFHPYFQRQQHHTHFSCSLYYLGRQRVVFFYPSEFLVHYNTFFPLQNVTSCSAFCLTAVSRIARASQKTQNRNEKLSISSICQFLYSDWRRSIVETALFCVIICQSDNKSNCKIKVEIKCETPHYLYLYLLNRIKYTHTGQNNMGILDRKIY